MEGEAKASWVSRVLGFDIEPGEEGEEAGQGVPGDPDGYQAYLNRALKRVRGMGRSGFGVALGRQRRAHRMALHSARSPRSLAAGLAQQTGLRAMTWGEAEPHPEDARTMLLHVEGKQLAGLKKKCDQMLQAFRPLPFREVVLMVGGEAVADVLDEEDRGIVPPAGLAGLPEEPGPLTTQATTFVEAAQSGIPFCEECLAGAAAEAE